MADFGLSQMVDSQGVSGASSMSGKGSVRWQAPELLNVGQSFEDVSSTAAPTTRSDTYAFAMVCLEVSADRMLIQKASFSPRESPTDLYRRGTVS